MTKKIKQPPKSKKSSSFAPPNGLPMVHVVMDAGGPRLSPSQVSPSREKPSVTILTVKQVYRRPNEPTRELTLVFANRERALAAMRSHLTNSDADTTINIRTLDVIR